MPDDTPAPTPEPTPSVPAPGLAPPTATMSPASDPDPRHPLIAAAERAAHTGDRNAVLTYMRLKRSLI